MFGKLLIANRGEIARRVIRTCRRLGIRTVAVYSEADAHALFRHEADEAVPIGPARAAASYLAAEKIVAAALETGAEAVHPGYGFLSENADFARAVARAGLAFVGPPAEALAALGSKLSAKQLAEAAGLSTVPGHPDPIDDEAQALALAERIGYPVLLKPAAGGGGKGMRIVQGPADMVAALAASRQEALKAFGDDGVLVERFVDRPRHVEIQIMADRHGNVVHLGERECSVQRRYQKIIEECPSVAVGYALRETMGRKACELARAAGYAGAGTVEFILDASSSFYFLEVNARLQVEHAVTELVTGLDLVELQLRIAAGEPLPLRQEDVRLDGWAIEARVCAEDPSRGFLPSTGLVTRYSEPAGDRVRVDSGIEAGSQIPADYDSLLAKVVAWGQTRDEARRTLVHALNGYHIEGVSTNVDVATAVLDHPAFIKGDLSTSFIADHFEDGRPKAPPRRELVLAAAIAATLIYHVREGLVRDSLRPLAAHVGGSPQRKPWHDYRVKAEGDAFEIRLEGEAGEADWTVIVDGEPHRVTTPRFEFYRRRLRLLIDGEPQRFRLQYRGNFIWVAHGGVARTYEIYSPLEWALARHVPPPPPKPRDDALRCPMPGLVVEVLVADGDRVHKGQRLVVIESMKMESGVTSPIDGAIERVEARPGQTVETGDVLLTFEG